MANPVITDRTQHQGVVECIDSPDELVAFAGADTYAHGTILGRRAVATAITPVADVGNTGDGTCTAASVVAGPTPLVGAYSLECISVDVAAGTAVAVASAVTGTGNGTVTAVTVDAGEEGLKPGAYRLTCLNADVQGGTATATASAVTGTGDGTVTAVTVDADNVGMKPGAYVLTCLELGVKLGTAVATASTITGTGNGVIGAATAGAKAKAGVYTVTCINADVSGSEIFSVITPTGARLADLTVAVAYSTAHFGITVADGSTDFTVGAYFTVTVSDSGGVWKLEDPGGSVLDASIFQAAGAGATTAVQVGGLNFTITDGGTDFAVGDLFTITVANTGGLWSLADPDGSVISNSIIQTAGALTATAVQVGGLNFTINDGSTDFIATDYFGITVTDTAGRWKLEDPNGALVSNSLITNAGALTATVLEVPGMTFTVTDGAADFIVGDKFSLPVVADGKLVAFAVGGAGGAGIPLKIAIDPIVATGSGNVAARPLAQGKFKFQYLVIDADGDNTNVTAAIQDQLRSAGILIQSIPDNAELDNA